METCQFYKLPEFNVQASIGKIMCTIFWDAYWLIRSGWQVKLRDPIVTHGPYLSALEIGHNKNALYKSILYLLTYVYLNALQSDNYTGLLC